MANELYQLVAIDKNNKEYIIELNNDNKKDKGSLSFIDYGTAFFKDSEALAIYLHRKGKIPTTDVYFSIKYFRNGPQYLPLIYNDSLMVNVIRNLDNDKYSEFVFYVLKQLEVQLSSDVFYRYITTKNIENGKQNSNGNYLNQKLINSIMEYYNVYIKGQRIDSNKAEVQHAILKEIWNYKQLRTLYMFLEEYSKKIENSVNIQQEEPSFEQKNEEELPDIPEAIDYAYKNGGMDGVYSSFDLDDLEKEGVKFR